MEILLMNYKILEGTLLTTILFAGYTYFFLNYKIWSFKPIFFICVFWNVNKFNYKIHKMFSIHTCDTHLYETWGRDTILYTKWNRKRSVTNMYMFSFPRHLFNDGYKCYNSQYFLDNNPYFTSELHHPLISYLHR